MPTSQQVPQCPVGHGPMVMVMGGPPGQRLFVCMKEMNVGGEKRKCGKQFDEQNPSGAPPAQQS